jgi:hypothetical protein
MNAMTVGFVLVRLAAAFLFVRGVQGLSSYSFLLTGDAPVQNFAVVTLVFGVLLPVAVAIILWLYPEKVTGAQVISAKSEEAVSAGAILMVGITLLGLYVFVYGVVDLFHVEALQMARSNKATVMNLPNEVTDSQAIASRVTYAAQIVLGLCLILGRNGLARLLLKAKYGGLAVSPPVEKSR